MNLRRNLEVVKVGSLIRVKERDSENRVMLQAGRKGLVKSISVLQNGQLDYEVRVPTEWSYDTFYFNRNQIELIDE